MAENKNVSMADASNSLLNDDGVSKLVNALLEEYHVPGVSIAVVDKGNITAKGFGIARFPDVAAKPDTLYFTGSTTKAMLAAATGILMQDKDREEDKENRALQILLKHQWETKIKSILSEDFELEDDYAASNITIEDALSHRSGLAPENLIYGKWMGRDPKGVVKALKYLGPLHKLSRTKYQYNNLMYTVVGELLKKITGLECGSLLKKVLWGPLGMASTYWTMEEIPKAQRQDLARGYYWVDGLSTSPKSDGYYITEPYVEFAGIAPAGATISSVNDYGRWIKELLRVSIKTPRPSTEEPVLTPELFEELTTPRIIMSTGLGGNQNKHLNLSAYGLGWIIQPPLAGIDHPIISHSGGLTGFKTQLLVLPNDDFGCVCLTNSTMGQVLAEIVCFELMARKLGLSDEVKSKIIDWARAKLPPAASQETPDSAKTEEGHVSTNSTTAASQETANAPVDEFLKNVTGEYSHPAYGTFRVSQYKSAIGERVIYMPWVEKSARDERDRRRSQQPCLLVSPVGHRTWKFQILLHVREDFSKSLLELDSDTNSLDGVESGDLFFDPEFMDGHGNIEDDAVTGFLTDVETTDQKSHDIDLREEIIWNSQFLCKLGAAFKFEYQTSSDSSSTKQRNHVPNQLGIRLSERLDGTDGSKNPGWEKDMVWFVKKS